jgi:hypothetical protein
MAKLKLRFIQACLQGKKIDKGGQHVLLLDSTRQYIYAWTPHHKFFEVVHPSMATGHAEVKLLVDMITPLVIGATKDTTEKRKQLFSECVHIAIDTSLVVMMCCVILVREVGNYDLQM